MTYIQKFYYQIFLSFFALIGIYFSINTGITHDEIHDYNVWLANKNSIINLLFSKNLDTSYLAGGNKFYGSGFHYLSSILELFSYNLPQLSEYKEIGKIVLSKHVSVFLFFLISGLFLRKIIKLLTNDTHHANLSSILYLSYPYLLGHSFFNVKDIPFLTFWLICTYFIIRIAKNYFVKEIVLKKHIIFLSLFTGYLLSIRITGILIFIEYLIFILVLLNIKNIKYFDFIKKFYQEIIISFLIILSLYIFLQPSFWGDPFLIYEAIKYMSQHIQTVCTITLGECMKAQNLPASYLPIWFFFKLPIIILFGLGLFFLIERKIKKETFKIIVLSSLTYTVIILVVTLILFEVNLYDEIRQVMFLIPLIFIVSLTLIHIFSKKFFNISISLVILFFIFQNIKIYPYNYIWINNFSHLTKVQNIFELDYWSASSKRMSDYIKKKNIYNEACIITNRNEEINLLVPNNTCLINFSKLHSENKRPFYVALMGRGVNKGTPNNCNLIFQDVKNLNFSNEKLILAKLYQCN